MNFVFDIDGTICFGNNKISEEIFEQFKKIKQAGNSIIFATARSYRDTLPLIQEYFADTMVVGLNGGVVYKNGEIISKNTIDIEIYQGIISDAIENNLPYFVDDEFNYLYAYENKIPFYKYVDPLKLARKLSLKEIKNPIKIVIVLSEQTEKFIASFLTRIKNLYDLDINYHSNEKCLYINPKNINKGTKLVELLGNNSYICFGNDDNDIEMFKYAKYAIQVGNNKLLGKYSDLMIKEDEIVTNLKKLLQ